MTILSNEEIGYVKFFLHKEKHFYFEVQVEVMDHFFSMLEEERPKYPSMIFSAFVAMVYKKSEKDLSSIRASLEKRLKAKYNQIFLMQALKPLISKYLILVILGVIVLFNLQSLLSAYLSAQSFYIIVGIINLIFLFKYMAPSDLLNGNYLNEKIAGNYGMVPWIYSVFAFLLIKHTSPIITSSGFNVTYLVTAIALVVKSMLIYAMVQTSNIAVTECKTMESASEALNA